MAVHAALFAIVSNAKANGGIRVSLLTIQLRTRFPAAGVYTGQLATWEDAVQGGIR